MGSAVNIISSKAVKNYCINGNFDFFQRKAASPLWVNEGNIFTADRWFRFKQTGGGAGVYTIIQDAGLGNGARSLRFGRVSGSSDVNQTEIIQALETRDSLELANKKVTLSFKVRKGANFSGTHVNFYLGTGTGVDQGVVTAWTGGAVILGTPIPAADLSTSSYYQASLTTTLGAISQLRFDINYVPVGTAGANDYIEIAEVMLNEGDLTKFVRCGESYDQEFIICKRYFERSYAPLIATGTLDLQGAAVSQGIGVANRPFATIYYSVEKRTVAIHTFYSPQNGNAGQLWDAQTASTHYGIASSGNGVKSHWYTPNGTLPSGGSLFAHWTAEAEL